MQKNRWLRVVLVWFLFILIAQTAYHRISPDAKENDLKASELVAKIAAGEVTAVEFVDDGRVLGRLKDDKAAPFVAYAADDVIRTEIMAATKAKGIPYSETPVSSSAWRAIWQGILGLAIPLLIMFFMLRLFMRTAQNQMNQAEQFKRGKTKEVKNDGKQTVRFSDVAGIDEVVGELEEVVQFLKDPKRFTSLGGRMPRGVLLMGPPGTGKTLLARAMAGEAGVPFFTISGSDFVEMFVGVGAARARDIFERVRKAAPAVLFIDEIDAVGRSRGAGLGHGHDEREQTLNQILVEMDGFDQSEGVIWVAATNRPDILDPALLRPGRFDRHVTVPRPDLKGREQILIVHARKVKLRADVDLVRVARATTGLTGADLENLLNEAAIAAAADGKPAVGPDDLDRAIDKAFMGPARKGAIMTTEEKRLTAVHEAGHTLAAWLTPGADPIHKVTIIQRGRALGVTMQVPTEDRNNYWRAEVLRKIKMILGGRLAEEVVYGDMNTGASNDIQQLSQLARRMVCEWGMSDKLGPLSYGKSDGPVFLGRDLHEVRDYSDETGKLIDAEVRNLVETCRTEVRDMLTKNRPLLDKLTDELLKRETLITADLQVILGPRPPFPIKTKPA